MKDIKDYEGLYAVGENGNVYSYRNKKFLKHETANNGYHRVRLSRNGKGRTVYIHLLVAQTFIDNPEGKPTVDHIDRNLDNNSVNNLRWATMREQAVNRNTYIDGTRHHGRKAA